MTIRSRNYPYNMAPWVAEKSEHICEAACSLVDQIRELTIPQEQREALLRDLHGLLYDATKLVEYAYDTDIAAWSLTWLRRCSTVATLASSTSWPKSRNTRTLRASNLSVSE